jgi:hypothetical protein
MNVGVLTHGNPVDDLDMDVRGMKARHIKAPPAFADDLPGEQPAHAGSRRLVANLRFERLDLTIDVAQLRRGFAHALAGVAVASAASAETASG